MIVRGERRSTRKGSDPFGSVRSKSSYHRRENLLVIGSSGRSRHNRPIGMLVGEIKEVGIVKPSLRFSELEKEKNSLSDDTVCKLLR